MPDNETIADIIAEMRGARTEFPFVYLMGEPDTPEVIDFRTKEIVEPRKINIRRVTVTELADRLESAHKRERGDCAKLREALVQAQKKINYLIGKLTVPNSLVANRMEINGIINAALAAPPRNCDIGSAEEQWRRFCDIEAPTCRAEDVCHCRTAARCFADWSQRPYKEGGAK